MKLGYNIVENVGGLLKDAKSLTFRYARQELQRFANRFKKKLARERMSGSPGINWFGAKNLKSSKHFKYFVEGSSLNRLAMVSRISGILMMHETGGVIHAKQGGWLYLFDRRKKFSGKSNWTATKAYSSTEGIVGRVKQVTLKPRLEFKKTFMRMLPEERIRLNKAIGRALTVAREKNIKPTEIMLPTKL